MRCFLKKKLKVSSSFFECVVVACSILIAGLFFDLNATELGDVQSCQWNASSKWYDIVCGSDKARIVFLKDDIFRIWVGPGGTFSAGAQNDIVQYTTPMQPNPGLSDQNTYYKIETNECVVRINKSPCKFSLYQKDNSTIIFEEQSPIDISSNSLQTMKVQSGEQFYGCGMYNGHFCHTGLSVPIKNGEYELNDTPNIMPYYCSLKGYGVYRNTWSTGTYAFTNPVKASHAENRFDAYYFYGPTMKKVVNGYTFITGRPFMPPYWGIGIGIAGEYTGVKGKGTAPELAAKCVSNDLPIGWIMPDDSYESVFDRIKDYVPKLSAMNIYTIAWYGSTSGGSSDARIKEVVASWGVRGFKLDNSFIGGGYKPCLDALKKFGERGIEGNTDARLYQWTAAGWAGTQRLSVMWTGDNTMSWDWIKWHIPTTIGCAMSGMNGATVDMGGIFGDGEQQYTRTWQWQCWTPFMYIMNHWSKTDKLPWIHAPNYYQLLKANMKLKTRLNAYMYSLCHEAFETGIAVQRPCLLEFPDDPKTQNEDAMVKQQFMCGPWFLVRPVFENLTSTDTVTMYLPGNEKWIDYYSGAVQRGGSTVQAYAGGFSVSGQNIVIPVFVREGAIVPMYPEQKYIGNKLERARDPITFDVYPHASKTTSYEFYEDDWLTREYKDGKFSKSNITCDATKYASSKKLYLTIGTAEGDFNGKPANHTYFASVHTGIIDKTKPASVYINHVQASEKNSFNELLSASAGWFYDDKDRGGIVWVKTHALPTNKSHYISLEPYNKF